MCMASVYSVSQNVLLCETFNVKPLTEYVKQHSVSTYCKAPSLTVSTQQHSLPAQQDAEAQNKIYPERFHVINGS
jgi:hypothetical protein